MTLQICLNEELELVWNITEREKKLIKVEKTDVLVNWSKITKNS